MVSRSRSFGKALAIVVGGVAVMMFMGGAVVWLTMSRASESPPTPSAVQAKTPAVAGKMSEEERVKYIEAHVRVSGLELGPDKMPDRDEVVPGLMRVSGEISNSGSRTIHKVMLAIFPEDKAGKVVGSYYQNIVPPIGLAPSATHKFKFQIPARSELSGKFKHDLR